MILSCATHNDLFAVSSHAYCCSIKSSVAVAVWDVIGFQFLLQCHLVSDVSLAGQVMMLVNCFSFEFAYFGVFFFLPMLTLVCVVPLLKVVARNSSLGIKIPGLS